MPGCPDGTHPLDHWWITAKWRVDDMPPVVRLVRYTGCGMQKALIQVCHPTEGPKRCVVKVKNLQWCGVPPE